MKNSQFNKLLLLDVIFCLFPASLILGNLATNLNILGLALFTLLLFPKQIFKIKFNNLDKLLFIFFAYILATLLINYIEHQLTDKIFPYIIIFKTIFFFKYLILYITLRFLISENLIKLNLFRNICALCVAIIIIDIYIQFFAGKNIIGMEPISNRHLSSFFGSELIAGGYIQKFSLFIFFLTFFIEKKQKYKLVIQFILYITILYSIILSGNRMPLFLYLFSFLIFIFFYKISKKQILNCIVIIFIALFFSFKTNSTFQINLKNFYYNGKFLISTFFDAEIKTRSIETWNKPYVTEFQCGKEMMKLNPFFGGGIRFYRTFSEGCNSHPHNYYMEIVSDLGIVGLFLIIFFIYRLFYKILKNYKLINPYDKLYFEKTFPIFVILLLEFFPFRSTGSFFTTNNATIIFIMIAILVSYSSKNTK